MIPEQLSALALARRCIQQTNRSLFLTGRAGTGKTTFLKQIVEETHKNVMVVAPTAVAAINAGGATIHSVFQLPFGMFLPQQRLPEGLNSTVSVNTPQTLVWHMQMGERKRSLLRGLELLIIDEVSMLRADLLDAVDTVLRHVRKRPRIPFGGVQVLFIGDLLQLPPVVKPEEWNLLKAHYKSMYFFDAKVLQEARPLYIELETVYRQADGKFLDLLNKLRENALTATDVQWLNSYYRPGFVPAPGDLYITLSSHNYKADAINNQALKRIQSASHFYTAKFQGDFPDHACPVDINLELRIGSQVMFIKNDPSGQQRFFNGKIGTVTGLAEEHITVNCDGESIEVEPYLWKNIRYVLNEQTNTIEESELGTLTQYPLKLAWAITVHKSQGLTFDKAILDIGDVFASGQAYVALSRLRSVDGLVLLSPLQPEGIAVDKEIISYAQANQLDKPALNERISEGRIDYLKQYLLNAFDLDELVNKLRAHRDSYTKDELRSAKQKYKPWADALLKDTIPVRDVAAKFQRSLHELFKDQATFQFDPVLERTRSSINYFTPVLKELISKIREQINYVRVENHVRKYQTELYSLESAFHCSLQQISRTEKFLEALRDNTDPDKQTLGIGVLEPEQVRDKLTSKKIRNRKQKNKEGEEIPKLSSAEITFQLFNEGLAVPEIAQRRSMAVSTIEGHLADHVAKGKLPAEKLIDIKRMQQIICVVQEMETPKLSSVKEILGDSFSYAEIRIAVAHLTFTETNSKETV